MPDPQQWLNQPSFRFADQYVEHSFQCWEYQMISKSDQRTIYIFKNYSVPLSPKMSCLQQWKMLFPSIWRIKTRQILITAEQSSLPQQQLKLVIELMKFNQSLADNVSLAKSHQDNIMMHSFVSQYSSQSDEEPAPISSPIFFQHSNCATKRSSRQLISKHESNQNMNQT